MPLLLLDYSEYQNVLNQFQASKYAETRYFIEPIRIAGSFHPKVILSIGDEQVSLIIGSANITTQGFTTNAEICSSMSYSIAEASGNQVIRDVVRFFQGISPLIESEPHRTEIEKTLSRLSFSDKIKDNKDTYFLHNLESGILDQIIEIVDEDIESIQVLSPFFSPNTELISLIQSKFSRNISFYLDPRSNNFPVESIKEYENIESIIFYLIKFPQNRHLHAKAILLKGKRKSYFLFGSANFTDAALLKTHGSGGNIECCILRISDSLDYFDNIFSDKYFRKKEIKSSEIESKTIEYVGAKKSDVRITQAVFKEGGINLKLDRLIGLNSKVIIHIGELVKDIFLPQETSDIRLELSEDELAIFNNSAVVEIEIQVGDERLKSDRRLLYNPQYLPDQYNILQGITSEDERVWLFKIFNKYAHLPTFNYIIPLIERLSDYGIFDLSQTSREDLLLKIQKQLTNIKPYDPQTRLQEIIERFRKRHETRLKKAQELDANEALPTVLDSFVMINKLIIWSVQRGLQDINYLRFVKGNIAGLTIEDDKFLTRVSPENITASGIIEHMIALTYIVDSLHRNSRIFDEKNKNERTGRNYVKESIDQGFIESISYALELAKNEKIQLQRLGHILEEYKPAIIDLTLSQEDAVEAINNMIDRVNEYSKQDKPYDHLKTA